MFSGHIRHMIVASFLTLGAVCAFAQNNPYKISDSLYEYYVRAQKLRSEPVCMAVGDTMYNEAVKMGDLKAQCIAMTIPVAYYSSSKDISRMVTAAEQLRSISRLNGYPQYVYYSYSQTFTTYLNRGMVDECNRILDEMYAEARETDDAYGLSQCMTNSAKLYHFRQHYNQAERYYIEAAELLEKAVPEQSPSGNYLSAADCMLQQGDYRKALKYIEKAEGHYNSKSTLLNILDRKAECHYMMGNDSAFVADVAQIREVESSYGKNSRDLRYRVLLKARSGNTDEAVAELHKTHNGLASLRLAETIYKSKGNYTAALREADSAFMHLLTLNAKVASEDIAEASATIDNERLKTENALLESGRNRTISIFAIVLATLLLATAVILFVSRQRMRRKNIELEQAKDKAERSEKMKTLFVQNMSHEIRTPLNSVVGFSQLLAEDDGTDPEGREEYSQIISENADQLATLIDDILNISDIESGKCALNPVNLHCNEICRETFVTMTSRVPAGVELQFESEVPDEFTVRADRLRVRQVLTNLIGNACKFTEKGMILVTVSIRENPGFVTFAVADSGAGIPEDKAEAIFERFEKLGSFKPGTGLGLPICRMIAQMMDGRVWLDTEYKGAGARFVFTLPTNRQ